MLGFKRKSRAASIDLSALAVNGPVEKIAGVELHAGLRGQDFQNAAAGRLLDTYGEAQALPVQNPVVIVAVAELQLLIIRFDALADRDRLAEIEWRAGDGAKLAGGDERGVDPRETVGMDGDDVAENIAIAFQIEVGMIGEVEDRVFVGGRLSS